MTVPASGVELLLSTDVRAAAPHARFGLPEVKWSVFPFSGATIKLVQQIGYVHAMELLMTVRLIDAVEATHPAGQPGRARRRAHAVGARDR